MNSEQLTINNVRDKGKGGRLAGVDI